MSKLHEAPEEIFLQVDPEGDGPGEWDTLDGATWCQEKLNHNDVRYVRSDRVEQLEAENAEWKEKAKVWLASPEAAAQLDGYQELGAKVAALEAENKRLLTVAKQARLVLRNGKGKADSLSIVAAKLCDKVLVPNQAEHSIDLQVAALQAEVERLKAIPMKYRRIEFNAQLQNENDELRNRIEQLEADLATSRGLKQIWQTRAYEAEKKLAAAQAKIDALMLEYCPEEMTPEQIAEWGRNQERG